MSYLLLVLSLLSLMEMQSVGTGETNDGKTVTLLSDGTWTKKSVSPQNTKQIKTYESMKKKVIKLCAKDDVVDTTMSLINTCQSLAKTNGISKENYWSCLDKATGCSELISLADVCREN